MQHRKLDMGKAWTQATALMGGNRDTISAIAGLFFFLPTFAVSVFVPELANPETAGGLRTPAGAGSEAAMRAAIEQVMQIYAANLPLLIGLSVLQLIGVLGLLALLTDRANPTVGEALRTGAASTPSYIATQLITSFAIGLVIGLPLVLIATAAPGAILLFVLIAVPVMIYALIKLSQIAPVIAIEGVRNPLTAIARSWRLTKGNSLRIFLFLFLLLVIIMIIALLVTGILGLILAAFGDPVTTIGIDVVNALVNSVVTAILLVVNVAIHRQLAGPATEALAETFE
jgi:hypothetical protein